MIDLGVNVPAAALQHLLRHRKRGRDNFGASFGHDYLEIMSHLPPVVDRIIDIGCGMAGIDVLLKRHYPKAELWLLDGDGNDQRDGWQVKRPEPFSSRALANELLAMNGMKADRWIDVNTKEHLQADLVISLASWGYHYPLSTYNVTGFCIADLRKSEEPKRGTIINEHPKRWLCAWQQKGKA